MSTLLGVALCELSTYAGDSFKIPPVAHDPCWAAQRLGLRWLKEQHRQPNMEWFLMTGSYRTESYHRDEAPNTFIWWQPVVSLEPCWSIQDNLCSCVHLEKITPTRSQTFIGRRWKKSEVFKMAIKSGKKVNSYIYLSFVREAMLSRDCPNQKILPWHQVWH